MTREFFGLIVLVLSLLALPAVLIWAYEKWVARPKRVPDVNGTVPPPPAYVRIADFLLPFTLFAVVLRIGVGDVFAWAREVAVPLSWVAVPVGLWLAIDSWFFAPRRQARKGAAEADPPLMRAAYAVLPVLVIAVIVRMISAETLDFSLVLLLLSVATGLVWAIDHFFVRKHREAALQKALGAETPVPEPGTVDYARSFFPVAFIVLLVRAFIFEPFRIPSDSMMPTLLDGDFIVVNKYAYGLRWPVLNQKFVDTGAPQRGDVVVFRYPPKPSVNYIKRLVGLPGDRVEVRDDHLVINGERIAQSDLGPYSDGCYLGDWRRTSETLGEHTHEVLSCRSPVRHFATRGMFDPRNDQGAPVCDRKKIREDYGGWVCNATDGPRDAGDQDLGVVPPGHYLMIGDNRDNSEDGRVWGFVPDENLVGKATRIWFNFDVQRSSVVNWSRIGDGIQ